MDSLIATNNNKYDQNSVFEELDEHFLKTENIRQFSPTSFDWTHAIEDLPDMTFDGPNDLLVPPVTDLPPKTKDLPSATTQDNPSYIKAPR